LKRYLYIVAQLLLIIHFANGQESDHLVKDTVAGIFSSTGSPGITKPDKKRIWIVGGGQAALWTGSFIALNKAWYADYPRESFHFFNDWNEWQQMDKVGHAWTSYQISRLSGDMWRWTGINEKKAIWLGGISGVAYMSIIEILDGFSAEWGFSTGDMLMNIAGAGLYVSQELGWKEQRIQLKMSYYPYAYDPQDKARALDLFGESTIEKILKDYNAQTYWLSANIHSFFPDSRIPRWLNVSLGYNARVMLGGTENIWTDEAGNTIDRTEVERYRRFFLSVDVDLTKIRTRSKFLRSVFSVVNMVKVPAPALEWDSRGKFRGHLFYF
jgi:Predicted periplasmic lipoprotein (DUF2279)